MSRKDDFEDKPKFQPLKNEKGVALLMALFTVMLIWYIVIEVVYDASVEFNVNSSRVNEVKAYYAAKSGLELGLLRVLIYRKVMHQFGDMLQQNPQYAQMIEPLWKFPFAWPPQVPEELVRVDAELINDAVKKSKFDAQYFITIEDEGSKIDVNDLASPSEALGQATRLQLINIFENKIQNDPEWAQKNRNLDYQAIINHMEDWLDEDSRSLQGGAESAHYPSVSEGSRLPPNRGFRSVKEVQMVSGMTDEIFALIEPRITVFGTKAINPNYASNDVLKSLSPNMTDEIVTQIRERLDDPNRGKFQNLEDFENFLSGLGISLPKDLGPNGDQGIPLIFDKVTNFKVISTGSFANSTHQITAIAYDLDAVAAKLTELMPKDPENPDKSPDGDGDAPPKSPDPTRRNQTPNTQNKPPTGRPRIVYWQEK